MSQGQLDGATQAASRSLIESVVVVGMFGRYTYRLHAPKSDGGRVLLLHGENGAGKTTVLRLLWHLLSSAEDQGHRTFVARTPFESMRVSLSDGSLIRVQKDEGLVGDFTLTVERPGHDDIVVGYPVDEQIRVRRTRHNLKRLLDEERRWVLESESKVRTTVRSADGRILTVTVPDTEVDPYIQFLDEQLIVPIMLSDDRTLHSDDPELTRWRERVSAVERADDMDGRRGDDRVSAELRVTLRRVTEWFRRLTIGGQNSGFEGANSIYKEVLLRLASPAVSESESEGSGEDIRNALANLGEKSVRFEEFGLVPHFEASEFLEVIDSIDLSDDGRRQLARDILAPYLATLATRYEALATPERMLRTLVYVANDFLTDKRVTFNPVDGLIILTRDGVVLGPEMLSSGERQLCTLLCTTILAGRDSRLFLIDEPELSLGVEWQRLVMSTLLRLTEGSGLQFVLATHSLEIISGQPESVVRMVAEAYEPTHVL